MSTELKYCANCGEVVTARFCANCGASYAKKEISIKSLASVIFETVTNWEEKMVRTLKYLIIEPGQIAHAFISGERRKYFHPVKFVLFWGGVNFFISNYLKVGLGDIDQTLPENSQQALKVMASYGSFFFISVVPLLALAPYLVFRKTEPRFVHHTVMLCYITGMNLLISIPTITLEGLWKPFASAREIIGAIFPLLYCIYFYHSYFQKPWWKCILTGLLTMCFLLVGSALIITALEVIFLWYDTNASGF
jgi:hypothetical protein